MATFLAGATIAIALNTSVELLEKVLTKTMPNVMTPQCPGLSS